MVESPSGDGTPAEPQPSELVKGFEYEKNRYVVLEPEELEKLVPETSKEMEILEFVHLSEIDPVFFETSYYVVPEEAGVRPYSLLLQAMREAGRVGVAKLAMHRREHIILVRPGRVGLIAHTMFFADEVRGGEEYNAPREVVNPRELSLAKHLIESMSAPFEPEKFSDSHRANLERLIQGKLAGKQVAAEAAPAAARAPVVDIVSALERSLAAMKKPSAAESSPAKPRKRKAAS